MNVSKKILLVEDEIIIALDLKLSLENQGYIVSEHVTKGEDVINSILNNKPDLILMDIKLAGEIDGVETAQMVHDNFNIPVIFITSYSNKQIIERAKKTNPFGYIVKPFEDRELYTNIEIAFFKHEVEIKLKESEKKYRELSESIQQIIFECDVNGLISYLNEPGMQLLGVTYPEIAKGIQLNSFMPNDTFDTIKKRIAESPLQNKLNHKREYHLINNLGKHISIEEYTSPVYYEGKLNGYRGILIDITSKKLKENLSSLYYKITVLFKENDVEPQNVIDFILAELGNLLYYVEDIYFNELDLINNSLIKHCCAAIISSRKYSKGLSEYILEKSVPLYLRGNELDVFNKQNELITFEKKAVCWSGFPLSYSNKKFGVFAIQSFKNESAITQSDFDNLYNFFISVQSFLDRISNLKLLKQSETKYKNLINSINDGVIQINLKNEVTFVNDQLCELLEYSQEEILGKNLFDVFKFDSKNKAYIENRILGKKESLNTQYYLQTISKSGKIKEIAIIGAPLFNENGNFIGILGTITDLTEKKEYLKLIMESEQKFKAIFDQAAVGVAIVNSLSGEMIDVNKKYCEIFKYTKQELLKKNFKDFTHEDDLYVCLSNMDKLIKGEIKEFAIEKRHYNKNGETVWVKATISPLWKPNEEPTNHIVILENISERKITEKSLIKSEKEKENILKSIPDSFVVINKEGKIISSYLKNNEIVIKRNIHESINGKHINDAFIECSLKSIIDGIETSFKKLKLFIRELELNYNDQLNYLEVRFVPINNENILLIIRDITEKKKNILEIQKFYNITEQTKELIVITDKKGRIEYVNPMFMEVSGYKLDEVIGKTPSMFKSNKHPKSFFTELWRTIIAKKSFKIEITNAKKNGELYIEEKIISPIINSEEEITHFISTGRDITEDKKREKKILTYQKFEKTLEKKEQKYRTLSLIQGQENERKRIAREIHDGLGQMLTVISANLEGLSTKNLSSNERKNKAEIVNQMVTEVIQESRRISHNLSPVGLYEFGLNAIILQLIKRIQLNYNNININYISNLENIRFKTDTEINLYRIIQEVTQNSLKHSKCKTILITINYENSLLKLTIKDDGIGFNMKQLENSGKHFNGIRNIEERAKIIDAKLEIETDIEKGYTITLKLKLKLKLKKTNND